MKRENPWNIVLEEITFMLKTCPYNRNLSSLSGIFLAILSMFWQNIQKRLFRRDPIKWQSENMQQICRKTPMSECDFDNVNMVGAFP